MGGEGRRRAAVREEEEEEERRIDAIYQPPVGWLSVLRWLTDSGAPQRNGGSTLWGP